MIIPFILFQSFPIFFLQHSTIGIAAGQFLNSSDLLHLLDDLGSDSVHIGDTLGGKGLAHGHGGTFLRLELGSSDEASLLEFDEAVADVLASSLSNVLSAGSVVLLATVMFTETVDTDLLLHVDLVGDGGSAVVQPVAIIGGELSKASSLSVLGPLKVIINKTKRKHYWTRLLEGALTSCILILFPFLRCLAKASMKDLAGTSLTVFPCALMRARCC